MIRKEAALGAMVMTAGLLASAACRKSAQTSAPEQSRQTFVNLSLNESELGRQIWSLEASSATLDTDAQTALLFSPRMNFYKGRRVSSTLAADSGTLDTQTQDVHMQGDVVVKSLEDKTVLRTSALDYLSRLKKFRTNQKVVITRPSGVIHGDGLEADSDFSRIRIFHQESIIPGKKG